jgi:hypothetical protein
MKVLWLNEGLTDAALVRGRWWWKRAALVKLVTVKKDETTYSSADFRTFWKFVASDMECSSEIAYLLNEHRRKEKQRQLEEKDWQPYGLLWIEGEDAPAPRALPEARTVER